MLIAHSYMHFVILFSNLLHPYNIVSSSSITVLTVISSGKVYFDDVSNWLSWTWALLVQVNHTWGPRGWSVLAMHSIAEWIMLDSVAPQKKRVFWDGMAMENKLQVRVAKRVNQSIIVKWMCQLVDDGDGKDVKLVERTKWSLQ